MPLNRIRSSRGRTGVSALEIAASTFIFGAVLAGAGQAMGRVASVWASSTVQNETNRNTGRLLQDVRGALADVSAAAIATDLAGPGGASSITFRRTVNWANGAAVLGDLTTIAWELDRSEKLNGVDDDGDGLIDEGCVVLTQKSATSTRTAVLANNVPRLLEGEMPNGADDNGNGLIDEPGFVVCNHRGGIRIRITLVRMAGGKELVSNTMETSVVVRK